MWSRFKAWFKQQSTGRQYAVVLGTGFVLLVLLGAISGGDDKNGNESASAENPVTARAATTTQESAAPQPSSSELVAQAHQAVKQDNYAEAVALVAGLSTAKRNRLGRMISRRIAFRARSAIRRGDRAKAKRLLRRARKYPQVPQIASARTALTAATATAALKREQRAAAAAQAKAAREAAAQQKAAAEEQQAASSCEPGYDPCVPVYPPDLDCGDLSGPYSVTGSDPHGLDADGDGVGCE